MGVVTPFPYPTGAASSIDERDVIRELAQQIRETSGLIRALTIRRQELRKARKAAVERLFFQACTFSITPLRRVDPGGPSPGDEHIQINSGEASELFV